MITKDEVDKYSRIHYAIYPHKPVTLELLEGKLDAANRILEYLAATNYIEVSYRWAKRANDMERAIKDFKKRQKCVLKFRTHPYDNTCCCCTKKIVSGKRHLYGLFPNGRAATLCGYKCATQYMAREFFVENIA